MRFLFSSLVLLTMAGCTASNDNPDIEASTRRAIGVETKTGQALTSKELCTGIKTDASGKSTVDTLQFTKNSVYVKRTLLIDSQVQFVPLSTTKGHWGLLNDSLIFNDKGVQTSQAIKTIENSNGLTCFQIGNTEAQTYCPCN